LLRAVGKIPVAVDFRAVVQNPEVEEGHRPKADRQVLVEAVQDLTVRRLLGL
jgi:hypothetical protein